MPRAHWTWSRSWAPPEVFDGEPAGFGTADLDVLVVGFGVDLAHPLIPVECGGDGLPGELGFPGAGEVHADDLGDLADVAVANEHAGTVEIGHGSLLATDLEDAALFAHGADHGSALGHGECHGLFHVDIFAGEGGVDGMEGVPMVGAGDNHGVDVLALEYTPVILVNVLVINVEFSGEVAGAGEVDIADCTDSDIVEAVEGSEVGGAAVADPDAGDDDFFTGGGGGGAAHHVPREDGEGGDAGGATACDEFEGAASGDGTGVGGFLRVHGEGDWSKEVVLSKRQAASGKRQAGSGKREAGSGKR